MAEHNPSLSNILSPWSSSKGKQKIVAFSLPAAETPSSYAQGLPVPSASEDIIECFCSTIRDIAEIETSVGVLVSSNSKHRVWALKAPLTSARAVSLAELLCLPAPSMEERFKLSVRLALSVLQFHGTGLLQDRWGKQDIYLVQQGYQGYSPFKNPSLEIPVVRHVFTPEPSAPGNATESHIFSCNWSLFSLGIVLIELWFWRSVESFQSDKHQDPDMARFITAAGLIDTLYEGAGAKYGSSVQCCIRGIDQREPRLENDEFMNEVYLKVLWPLEMHLEDFCGRPLGEIFEG